MDKLLNVPGCIEAFSAYGSSAQAYVSKFNNVVSAKWYYDEKKPYDSGTSMKGVYVCTVSGPSAEDPEVRKALDIFNGFF